jgi:hypothetical protein
MELPLFEMSFRGVKILEEQIQDPTLRSQQVRFNAFLHKRASCAPPRGANP